MKKVALGMRSLVPVIDLLISSPLLRATQTARIIADVYGDVRLMEREELAPGAGPRELINLLAAQRKGQTICIVGHEPALSKFLGTLLKDESELPPKLKKGSAALVKIKGPVSYASGVLQWYCSARELASK